MNTLQEIKETLQGQWKSITPELRPSAAKNADGTLKPFYLSRAFGYQVDDSFTLSILNFADPFGKLPLAKIDIAGHIEWRGEHPIAEGAFKVDFTADTSYEVTPLHQGFTDILNKLATDGYQAWVTGEQQSIFKKAFLPFGLAEGQLFKEYDLIYLFNDLLFWGARNVDGRGFDSEENRPLNLQIPMSRS